MASFGQSASYRAEHRQGDRIMIGVWSQHAEIFLLALGVGTALLFSLPISFAPLRWARLVGWSVAQDDALALYFGRCLGAFALILNFFMLRAGFSGAHLTATFEFMALVWAAMIVVHVVGALQGVQPILETLEIIFWIALAGLTALFWPS
jgi:hypothetical protein